jgi:pimeloyl-ACP methyl ester carboxylesterase
MDQNIRFCTAADGVKLAYAVSGEGPPLVMSATWLSHLEHQWQSLAWRPWLDAFSRDHMLLRYDSRGCGLSDRDARDLSFETWARDFECVIEAASFQKFDIMATCWGGPVAIEYAARHPKRVNRLILYGTYGRGRLIRNDRPDEVEKARILLDLTRLGWGRENHAFLQVWGSHFQPVARSSICAPGAISNAPQPRPRRPCACLKSAGTRTWARQPARSNARS